MADTHSPRKTRLRSSRELLPLIAPARFGSSTWLLLLRWFAVAGQLLTILAAGSLSQVELPYAPLLGLVALTAVTNTLYGIWLYTLKPIDLPQRTGNDNSVELQTNWQRDTESEKLPCSSSGPDATGSDHSDSDAVLQRRCRESLQLLLFRQPRGGRSDDPAKSGLEPDCHRNRRIHLSAQLLHPDQWPRYFRRMDLTCKLAV